jgi:diadenosine tetraphosphate (Ap4A) HIT family hydrolase
MASEDVKLIHHHDDGECTFCNEFSGKGEYNFRILFTPDEFQSRILYRTEKFVVLPGLGPIGKIYLLILPREPYVSVASLPEDLLKEFQLVKDTVFEILAANFGSPISFEHGPSFSHEVNAGCCVEHAHLHVCVTDVDILEDIQSDAWSGKFGYPGGTSRKIRNISELKDWVDAGIAYIYYQEKDGSEWGFPVKAQIESQYLRKKLALRLGMQDPNWDWLLYPNKEQVRSTWDALISYFRSKNEDV